MNIPWEVAANPKSPPGDAEILYAFERLFMPTLVVLLCLRHFSAVRREHSNQIKIDD